MIFIKDLHDIAELNKELPFVALINGEEKEVSCQFYIENDICYYFLNHESKEESANGSSLVYGIELEAEDECWNSSGWNAANSYKDCEVCIADSESDYELDDSTIYDIKNIKVVNNKIVLECEEC